MQIYYLEVVAPDVDAVCDFYSSVHDVSFGESDPSLGGARTAAMSNGGMIGIRGPLRDTEEPVVRHYLLVDDIQAALAAASKSGAEIALPPMDLPGHGTCAITIHAGIETGFWQL